MTGVGHFGDGEQWHTVYSEMMNTLSTLGVSWTAIDPFRIGYEEEWDKPVIVLIGVRPGTLTDEDDLSLPAAGKAALEAAYACKQVLEKHDILDY